MTTPNNTTIPLTRGYLTIVDNIDSDLIEFKWYPIFRKHTTYARRKSKQVDGKRQTIFMHQVILSRVLGRNLLPGEKVDHKDGNGLNNCRGNLRLATHAQNMQNRKLNKDNTTGFKGVQKHSKANGYIARIMVEGKRIYLGAYPTPELAAAAYDQAALKYYGAFAKTNKLLKELS